MKLFIGSKFTEHDSSAYIINPSKKEIFAISSERITRYKHDYLYPTMVIEKYLDEKSINPSTISEVYLGLSFDSYETNNISASFNKKEVLLRKLFNLKYIKDVQNFKKNSSFSDYINLIFSADGLSFLYSRLLKNIKVLDSTNVKNEAKKAIQSIFKNASINVKCFDHATCHAISSYYSSSFKDATLITMDGYGDGVFSKAYTMKNEKLTEVATTPYQTINFNGKTIGSIGEIYSYFTLLLGFQPQADEGKVEALAAYGNHENELYKELISLITLDINTHTINIDTQKGYKLLQKDNLKKYLESMSKEDISAAVQQFLEDATIPYYKDILNTTKIDNLCISGGVAANVIMNLNIFENVTKNLHIIPAMGDEGTSEGAAILMMLENGYTNNDLHWIKEQTVMPYLGTSYTNEQIEKVLQKSNGLKYEKLDNSWPKHIASYLNEFKIGALFQGRMEWGPRALGNRSIIALTNDKDIRTKINKEIKKRPLFQPFCPSILIDEKDRLFENAYDNKHMTCAFRLKNEFHKDLPSSIHVDGTARVQFVSQSDNPNYYKLLQEVKNLTGFGVLINTSFNKHGRTIVETPQDAIDDFLDTDLDFLMIENYLVTRD